jgi:aldehyde:ferredoxin oxidoreductase
MSNLWGGSILHVDLSSGTVRREPTDRYIDDCVGGRGIAAKLIYEHVGPEIGALDPANMLVFSTGPLTATLAPGSSRTGVTARSPVTGLLGISNMGGYFGAELKRGGVDHLAVTGKSSKPVYLVVNDGDVEIRDASQVWGKDTYETPTLIRKELGDPNYQIATIGRAGENLVVHACVMTSFGHAATRTGMGAVMGSKNLKAIVIRGTRGVSVADPEKYSEIALRLNKQLRAPEETGEKRYVQVSHRVEDIFGWYGNAMAGNFQSTEWVDAGTGALEKFFVAHSPKRRGCSNCPTRCMNMYVMPEDRESGIVACQMHMDMQWKLRIADQDTWFDSVVLAQKLGIDWISASTILAWAMELYERGIIDERDTDGIPMLWGDRPAILKTLRNMADRRGFGDILAGDVATATQRVGKGSEYYMMHSKGLPLWDLNQRNGKGLGLSAAVGPRGDSMYALPHLEWEKALAEASISDPEEREAEIKRVVEHATRTSGTPLAAEFLAYEGKPALVILGRDSQYMADMLGGCKMHGPWVGEWVMVPDVYAELMSAGTGRSWTGEYLSEKVARLAALERAFDVRAGLTRTDESLPERFFDERVPGRFCEDSLDRERFEAMKTEYYKLSGWDPATGVPTREHLESLGLKSIADDLDCIGRLPGSELEKVEAVATKRSDKTSRKS